MVDMPGGPRMPMPTHVGGGAAVRNPRRNDSTEVSSHLTQDQLTGAEQQRLFVNQDANQASGFSKNTGMMSLNEAGLSGLQFLSQDMGVYVQVITGRMLARNPELAALATKLTGKLDDFLDKGTAPEGTSGLTSLAGILSDPDFAGLSKFQLYMLLYEYYLKKKRSRSDKKNLGKVGEALDELEQTETPSLIEGFKGFHQDVETKLNLLQEFKSSANSYHGEYSEILLQVDKQYAGNFRALLKELIKLNAHNSQCADVWQDRSRAYEQQVFLLENMHFETKLLNLMSLFCKFEGTANKLISLVKECTTLNLTSDLVDLLDGFDCARLLNTKCRVVSDAEQRKATFSTLLNANIEVVSYLPDKFFKQSTDRANLKKRLMDCTGSQDVKDAKNPFSRRQEYF